MTNNKRFFNDMEAKEFGEVISVLLVEMGSKPRKYTAETLEEHIGENDIEYKIIYNAKVAYRKIPSSYGESIVVEYIYLPKHLRGKGIFTKVMDVLANDETTVLYEPCAKWIKENWNKPMPQISSCFFTDGTKREFLVHGSKKECVVQSAEYQQVLKKVEGYSKREIAMALGKEAFIAGLPDSIKLSINMFMLFQAVDEVATA